MEQKNSKKRDYSLIPQKAKQELFQLVEKENYPIRVAGDLLKIKLSTAKLIVKRCRQDQKLKAAIKKQKSKHMQIKKEQEAIKSSSNTEEIVEKKQEEKLQMEISTDANLLSSDLISRWNCYLWQQHCCNNFFYQFYQ